MKKKIFIGIAAILIIVMLLFVLQMLVTPKYAANIEGGLTGEYYEDAGDHDVIFIGDCETYESFVPSVLWQEYGITSYVRGNPQQLVWHSYYILEETLKYEIPKAVVFNVYALKYGEPQSEVRNRMVFDTMKWSSAKIKGIRSSMTNDESFLDYVFPLLRYHSRITQLESEDFKYWFSSPDGGTDNGYYINTGVSPMPPSEPITDPAEAPIPDVSMEYLDKMNTLCEENGVKLILVKAPTNPGGYWWYDEWETQIEEYANSEENVSYHNFIEDVDAIGIDWQFDTHDGGLHLNTSGAEKMTKYFGDILVSEYGLKSRKDEAEIVQRWDAYYSEYVDKKQRMEEINK